MIFRDAEFVISLENKATKMINTDRSKINPQSSHTAQCISNGAIPKVRTSFCAFHLLPNLLLSISFQQRRTIEVSFTDKKVVLNAFDDDSCSKTEGNQTEQDSNKRLNFNGLIIEVSEPKGKKAEIAVQAAGKSPLKMKSNVVDFDMNINKVIMDVTSMTVKPKQEARVEKVVGSLNMMQLGTNSKVIDSGLNFPSDQLGQNSKNLAGTSNTAKVFTFDGTRKLPAKDLKIEPRPAVAEPFVIDFSGAAGLWTTKEPEEASPKAEPKAEPPPVTEEDWEIFKQFMDLPEPQQPCYKQLMDMSGTDLVANQEEFICSLCETFILAHEGIVLKSCLHNFCRLCLTDEIQQKHDKMGQVRCPMQIETCEYFIEDEEVKALLGDDYAEFASKVLMMLEDEMQEKERQKEADKNPVLLLLLDADNHDFIEFTEPFECPVCFVDIEVGDGVVLKNCLHKFCKICIVEHVRLFEEFTVTCPFSDGEGSCEFSLQEREIRGLVPPEMFEKHLEKSLKSYEGSAENAYHCKTPDCRGFIEIDTNVRLPGFTCPVCEKVNCIGCKVIHQGKNCQEYQDELNPDGKHQRENAESENAIRIMIAAGEAMYCPSCQIPVMKKDGCDFIQCITCKLGICWVTKKPRQPLRKQDGTIIDGCHCREVGGQICHPNCKFCH